MLTTLGAPERRRIGGRRPRAISAADPEPVPTARATVVRSAPFATDEDATGWLGQVDLDAELAAAVLTLNRALHAHRVAAADPYAAEVSLSRALVARVGYGSGDGLVEGRYGEAREVPLTGRRRPRRSMEAPEERFAALLGGREQALACEELVLRARADLNAGRLVEAALQARVAIEALLAARIAAADSGPAGASLATHREAIAAAANEALHGPVPGESAAALEEAVAAMEQTLRRHRLGA
ncbi:MAG: hypothetical protein QOE69_2383 [Thermoleophilaceae bacterium]|nr:hypothetical protein [Thermoleophilaceae bacterium]MEA2408264.1 hypothetical protein [Thermoleophilaceae bacterium]